MQFRNAVVLSAALFASGVSFAGPVVPGFDSNTFARSTSFTPIDIGFTVNFFGIEYTNLHIHELGSVMFRIGGSGLINVSMDDVRSPTIAPFISNGVDTRYVGGQVTYGVGTYDGQPAFGVNWIDIAHTGSVLSDGAFNSHRRNFNFASPDVEREARNSFQLIIVDRSEGNAIGDFDFVFNYDSIQWLQLNTYVGWSRGYRNDQPSSAAEGTNFELGADLSAAERLAAGYFLNGGPLALAGLTYTFQVRNGIVSDPIITGSPIPEPETWAMLLAGLGIVGMSAKRRRSGKI